MTTEGTPRHKRRPLRRWLALPLAAGFALALAAPAHATFPGENGKLAGDRSPTAGEFQIYTINPDGTGFTPLTADVAVRNQFPEWSPDGSRIAFESNRDNPTRDVHTMNADGSGRVNIAQGLNPAWSPDGAKIAFTRSIPFGAHIWTMNADGTGQSQLTTGISVRSFPDWSPDGSTIAFEGADGIYLVDAGTGVEVPLVGQADDASYDKPEWSADGSKIFYGRNATAVDGTSDVWSINANGTGAAPFTSATGFDGDPAPAPDGAKVAYASSGGVRIANSDGTNDAPLAAIALRGLDWQPISQPSLEPIEISKTTVDTSVEGKWIWKMGKWTTSKLEQNAKGPRPYTFKVLVDAHGFRVKSATVLSRVTLTNPNDQVVSGTLSDLLPGWACEVNGGGALNLPANDSVTIATRCTFDGDPSGPVTNTATFTLDEAHGAGPQPVSDQATTTIDETPPPNSPGQKVALRDPMWHNGKKVLRYLDAVNGPWSITASYTVKLIPPVTPGKCWWHHNTAHLRDVASGDKLARSNRVSVYICRPKDAPKGTKPKGLPKVDKNGIPIVTPRLGGPKSIPRKYRTRLRTRVMAPRRVFRGQAFRVKVTTCNLTRKRAYGTIVKVKIPKGLRVATRTRGIATKGRYAYWTVKALGPKRKLTRTLRLVAIRPGAKRIVAISNARNAKRSKAKKVVRVLRPRRDVS